MLTILKHALSKRKILILATIVVGLITVALFAAARSNKSAQAAPRPIEVQVVQVAQQSVPVYSEWIGTTDGLVNAEIKAQVTGYLLSQNYKEGSFVTKGQLLFEIDPRPFQAELDQAKGQLAQFEGQLEQATSQVAQSEAQVAQANSNVSEAEARLAQSQANHVKTQLDVDKYKPLAEQKAVTQQEYDNAAQTNVASQAQVKAAEAGVETARAGMRVANAQTRAAKATIATVKGQIENAKAMVRTAELNLSFTRIIAPIDGIAGIAQAQVGDLISTQSAPLTTVSTVDPIKVYFNLSEQEYLKFTRRNLIAAQDGSSVAQVELELVLADGTTYPRKGSFYFADRQVDPKTGAIRLAGIFLNPGNVLRPGQYGRVRAVTSTKTEALLIPQRALTELQGSYQVAVVSHGNQIEIRNVRVGDRNGASVIIEDGLKAGESVVVEGLQRIKPGTVVNPKTYTAKS